MLNLSYAPQAANAPERVANDYDYNALRILMVGMDLSVA
jgi:hypothetical protein